MLLDLDGVVHVGDDPVPGAREAVDRLREQDVPLRFLTNTTSRPRRSIVGRLLAMGVDASEDLVLTPAVAAAQWMHAHDVRRPALFVPAATADELAGFDPLPADGLRLDAGAFVRALEYAAGRTAVVLGKPDPAFFLAARPRPRPAARRRGHGR